MATGVCSQCQNEVEITRSFDYPDGTSWQDNPTAFWVTRVHFFQGSLCSGSELNPEVVTERD